MHVYIKDVSVSEIHLVKGRGEAKGKHVQPSRNPD